MKKIQRFLSVAGWLCLTAAASAGWGSSGGGYASSGGYGSSGGYSAAGYGSSGGSPYASGYGSSGGYSAGYGSSGGGYSAGNGSSGGVAHVGPLRRLVAGIHAHHAKKVAYLSGYGSSGGGSSGTAYRSGSYGSSGGGYGSSGSYSRAHYGSSGGGSAYGGSSGGYSHASYGSSGGSYQSGRIYSGSTESYGGVESSYDSGVIYENSAPTYSSPSTYSAPATEGQVVPPVPSNNGTSNASDWSNRLVSSSKPAIAADEIHLNVRLPESAVVYVNGNRTKSEGNLRHFVSRSLDVGSSYRFEVRAEREVDGRTVVEQRTVVLTPGSSEVLEFALAEKSNAADTVLKLNVPSDASVVLAGNGTKTLGEIRTYRTQELTPGQVWDDYKITVVWNGQVKEKTIRLIGGDELEISFNFDEADKIAMR